MQEGDLGGAKKRLEVLLQQYPNDIGGNINLGSVLAFEGRIEEAIQRFRRVLSVDPNNAMARRNIRVLESSR